MFLRKVPRSRGLQRCAEVARGGGRVAVARTAAEPRRLGLSRGRALAGEHRESGRRPQRSIPTRSVLRRESGELAESDKGR